MREFSGHVVSPATQRPDGSETTAALLTADTLVTVARIGDFSGGTHVRIDGEVYAYDDDLTDDGEESGVVSITLSTGLVADVAEGTLVESWNPDGAGGVGEVISEWQALVVDDADSDGIPAPATLHHTLIPMLSSDMPVTTGDSVTVVDSDGSWLIVNVNGSSAKLHPEFFVSGGIGTDTIVYAGTDGGRRAQLNGSAGAIEAFDDANDQSVNFDGEDNYAVGSFATDKPGNPRVEMGRGFGDNGPTTETRYVTDHAEERLAGLVEGFVAVASPAVGVTRVASPDFQSEDGDARATLWLQGASHSGSSPTQAFLTADEITLQGAVNATMDGGGVGTGDFRDSVDARVTAGAYHPGGTDVPITDGGTGVSTLPTGILKGAGTGAITAVTAPTGAVVGTTDVQTLTNKTLTTPAISSPTGLVKADVGLGSVDNTADTAKPVSTAQQTALNLKANLASPALTGTPTAPTQTAADNSTKIATTAYTDAAVSAIIASADAMVFKGPIDCSANPNYPAADRGHTYRVSVAGKIGGASGTNVEIGDLLLCLTDGTVAGTQAAVGASWTIAQSNIDGAVTGPASSVSGNLPTFNGTSGKVVQDSGVALTSLAPLASPALTGNPTAPTQAAANNSTRVATTAYVDTADNLKANLASPTFTGTPAAPTPTAADSTTKIATTAFVQGEIALKANLASPTFTGDPKAPTPAAADNDTSIATTAFVQGELTSRAAQITDYLTAQTNTAYAIPSGAKYLDLEVCGGGGGGGSGRRGAALSGRTGGGSGSGGGRTQMRVSVASLGVSTIYVTVGAGGTGGAAITADSTNGNNGTNGSSSAIRTATSATALTTLAFGGGGVLAVGGTASAGAGGSSANTAMFVGGNGGAGGANGGTGSSAGVTPGAPAGGGGGGGVTSGNVANNGGSGGAVGGGFPTGVTGGTAPGGAGTAGVDNPGAPAPGGGGGGGAGHDTGVGGDGGIGGRGAGGGGGGGSVNGFNSGKGGDGGVGYARIVAWF